MAMDLRLLRLPAVTNKTGDSRSPHYINVSEGLFTRPVKIGRRAVAWPAHEVDQIVAARIRGDSPAAIKRLVQQLHEARATVTAEAA